MMRVVVAEPETKKNFLMWEQLLARGNRAYLVTIHRKQITKITPVRKDGVCADVKRSGTATVDNGVAILKLLEKPFAQYLVVVCHGKIMEISAVEKELEVKVQDLDAEVKLESKKIPPKRKTTTKK